MHIGVLSEPSHFHTHRWVQGLQLAGVRVTVFSFEKAENTPFDVVHIPPRYSRGEKVTYLSYLYSGARLARALKEHHIDILNPINITPHGVLAERSGFRPIAGVAMGADILEYPPEWEMVNIPAERTWQSQKVKGIPLIKRIRQHSRWKLHRKNVAQALEASDLVSGDNLQLVRALRQWFNLPNSKVHLNRWGIIPEEFKPNQHLQQQLRKRLGMASWQKLVLSPRGLKPVYQADIILDAFEKLLRRGVREAKLVMLTAGYPIPEALAKRADRLTRDFPTFHLEKDLLNREEMAQLWNLTDVFISAPVYDGYSNSVSEGRYAGAIPVVNDIPANLELIRHDHNGYIVRPFNSDHLADALLEVLEDLPDLKARFAPRNRRWIETNACLEDNARGFVKACEKVLEKRRSRVLEG